ncbi:MAG: alpha-hydroxy-acid oxidizing protein, partial [Aeromicrobium sp.]
TPLTHDPGALMAGNFGDHQLGIYLASLGDAPPPEFPFDFAEWARRAEQTLPADVWDYVAGGAGDEGTQDANVAAFARRGLMPRMLSGAAERDLSVSLWGIDLPSPLLLAPVGVIGICTDDGHGDLAAARASALTQVPFIGSTLMQDPLEDVAAACGETPAFFQLYTPRHRPLAESLVDRAERAGYRAIVVTVDTWSLGYRPRDLAHGTFPQLSNLCLANYTSDPVFRSLLPDEADTNAIVGTWAGLFGDPSLTWDDLAWLRGLTDLPIVLKGICSPDDARMAVDAGVDGIYCSNHGGRQAASGPALEFLPGVVDAAGDLPVLFDSGVRSGVDAVKALALGATAVGIGRPYAYAAAVGGTPAIEHLVRCMLAEIDLTMGLNGYADLAALRAAGAFRID